MKKLIFFILIIISYSTLAQTSKYKIEGEVTGLQDTEVILAYYFGGKQYAKDTAISKNGKFTISQVCSLPFGRRKVNDFPTQSPVVKNLA